jgi:hypothetical protein
MKTMTRALLASAGVAAAVASGTAHAALVTGDLAFTGTVRRHR